MKKLMYYLCCVFGSFSLLSCGDFLTEYSQDLVYARSCSDLDEIMIGDGYMRRSYTSFVLLYKDEEHYYPYLHVMDDDIEEYVTGMVYMESADQPCVLLRKFYSWAKIPFSDVKGSPFRDVDWERLYRHIGYLNVIISYVREFKEDPEQDRLRVTGEALFLRGAYYFMLVNLYAKPYSKETADKDLGVPLNTTEYIESKFFERASVAAVYNQIVEDLKQAAQNLAGMNESTFYRANEMAARALLSRVYLYMGEWKLAREECDRVIALGGELKDLNENDGISLVSKTSPELVFTQGTNTTWMLMEDKRWMAGTYARYRVADDLIALYDKYEKEGVEDMRKAAFFKNSQLNRSVYLSKKISSGSGIYDAFLLRTAEVYLNKAEAQAMLDEPEAINTLKILLATRYTKMPPIEGFTGEQLVKFIREERRRELCFEGQRWFDLRRYAVSPKYPESKEIRHNVYKASTSYEGPGVSDGYYVLKPYGQDNAWMLPIPEYELVFNQGAMVDNEEREEREHLGVIE